MIWTVPRSWENETALIIAGGLSIEGLDPESLQVDGWFPNIITINDSWRLFPRADVFYFQDTTWWRNQERMNRRAIKFPICFHDTYSAAFRREPFESRWITANRDFDAHPFIRSLKLTGQTGFDPDPGCIRHGKNSGYQAIHLAVHFGVKRILLLGYDMRDDAKRFHWHHEQRSGTYANTIKNKFLPNFPTLVEPLQARGIEVVNCTPDSGLTCWPHLPLSVALERIKNGNSLH